MRQVWHFVGAYNAHRPNITYKSTQKEGNCCNYYEKPMLIPIFQTRLNDPRCYPTETTNEANGYCLGKNQATVKLKTRNNLYFPNPIQNHASVTSNLNSKNIKFGYLHLNDDLKSIGDLVELNSDEIGLPHPPVKKEPVKLWKLDEVKSMTGPQFLPDVLLMPEDHGIIAVDNADVETIIDDHEINLGRFVVDDTPQLESNLLNIQIPQVGVTEGTSNVQAAKKYVGNSHRNVPEIVVDKVTQLEEPDFMEELQKMKSVTHTTPSYVLEPYIEETFTESYQKEEPVTEMCLIKNITGLPVQESSIPSSTAKSNVIEKQTTKPARKRDSRRRESRKRHRKVETPVEDVTVPSVVLNPAPITTIENQEQEVTNTSMRFARRVMNPMDELLSAL